MMLIVVIREKWNIIIGESEKKKGWKSQALPTKKMRGENRRPFNVPSSNLGKGNHLSL